MVYAGVLVLGGRVGVRFLDLILVSATPEKCRFFLFVDFTVLGLSQFLNHPL
jgi:hypothetical protein